MGTCYFLDNEHIGKRSFKGMGCKFTFNVNFLRKVSLTQFAQLASYPDACNPVMDEYGKVMSFVDFYKMIKNDELDFLDEEEFW